MADDEAISNKSEIATPFGLAKTILIILSKEMVDDFADFRFIFGVLANSSSVASLIPSTLPKIFNNSFCLILSDSWNLSQYGFDRLSCPHLFCDNSQQTMGFITNSIKAVKNGGMPP